MSNVLDEFKGALIDATPVDCAGTAAILNVALDEFGEDPAIQKFVDRLTELGDELDEELDKLFG